MCACVHVCMYVCMCACVHETAFLHVCLLCACAPVVCLWLGLCACVLVYLFFVLVVVRERCIRFLHFFHFYTVSVMYDHHRLSAL